MPYADVCRRMPTYAICCYIYIYGNIDILLILRCVSSYYCMSVLILLHMCPHTTICVLTLCVLMLLCMCPHTTIYVSSYCYICVLILLYVSSHYTCVLILLNMCPHATFMCPHATVCVRILLHMCPHATMCPHTTTCPHTTVYVSSCYYICVLILNGSFATHPHTIWP